MDLMHRYEPGYEEVASEYEGREVVFRHQCETAEIILVDSEVGKGHVLESYGEDRKDLAAHIRVLPMIPPDYIYHHTSIQQISFELFDKYIFYPAQFWTHKNHVGLISAVARLRDRGTIVNAGNGDANLFWSYEYSAIGRVCAWLSCGNFQNIWTPGTGRRCCTVV